MNRSDINELVTKKDLNDFGEKMLDKITLIIKKSSPAKEFISPKEFSAKTGIPYSTVIFRCKTGKLSARQENPNSTWQISMKELERFNNEARENIGA